jgi:hypothetical protein
VAKHWTKRRVGAWLLATLATLALAAFIARDTLLSPPFPDGLELVHESPRFRVRTDAETRDVAHDARVLDAFHAWFSETWFPTGDVPLDVYWFADTGSYSAYCRRFRFRFSPFGFYVDASDLVIANREAGLGTALHEVVHHFVRYGFVREPPRWIDEGFAAFFEKVIGHLDAQGRLTISVGYFNPWRFRLAKRQALEIGLEELAGAWEPNQNVARAFMLWLHRHGRLQPFMRRLAAGDTGRDGLDALEATLESDVVTTEQRFRDWIRAQPIDDDVDLLERSFVLDAPGWERWWAQNRTRLEWSPADARYRKTVE